MPKAEGRYFEVLDQSHIDTEVLETIAYDGHKQTVEYFTDEFSAVCPFSGLPDWSKIWIRYIPKKNLVELKSLKYYFVSFRSVGIYQEEVTNRLYADLRKLLDPEFLEVKTVYKTRGGIDATCSISSEDN